MYYVVDMVGLRISSIRNSNRSDGTAMKPRMVAGATVQTTSSMIRLMCLLKANVVIT
jgi:hypothetical protein